MLYKIFFLAFAIILLQLGYSQNLENLDNANGFRYIKFGKTNENNLKHKILTDDLGDFKTYRVDDDSLKNFGGYVLNDLYCEFYNSQLWKIEFFLESKDVTTTMLNFLIAAYGTDTDESETFGKSTIRTLIWKGKNIKCTMSMEQNYQASMVTFTNLAVDKTTLNSFFKSHFTEIEQKAIEELKK